MRKRRKWGNHMSGCWDVIGWEEERRMRNCMLGKESWRNDKSCQNFGSMIKRLYSERSVGYGTLCYRADYNLTLSHCRLRSLAFHPNYKGNGRVGWGRSLLVVGHMWELTSCLRKDILWSMVNVWATPIPELTLNRHHKVAERGFEFGLCNLHCSYLRLTQCVC